MPTRLVLLVFVVLVAAAVAGLIGGNSVNSPSAPDVETAGKQIVAAGENVIEQVKQGPTPALPSGLPEAGSDLTVGSEAVDSQAQTGGVLSSPGEVISTPPTEGMDLAQPVWADYVMNDIEINTLGNAIRSFKGSRLNTTVGISVTPGKIVLTSSYTAYHYDITMGPETVSVTRELNLNGLTQRMIRLSIDSMANEGYAKGNADGLQLAQYNAWYLDMLDLNFTLDRIPIEKK